jgi:hypothetical protein
LTGRFIAGRQLLSRPEPEGPPGFTQFELRLPSPKSATSFPSNPFIHALLMHGEQGNELGGAAGDLDGRVPNRYCRDGG